MKKEFFILILILVFAISVPTLAFAMAKNPTGSKPGTCEHASWGCNAWSACYVGEAQYYRFPVGSESRKESESAYNDCAREFVSVCMKDKGCDAKKYFPNLF